MDIFISDFMATAKDWFLGGDWQLLGLVALVAIIVALTMRGIGQLLGASVFAMILLAVGKVVVDVAQSETPSDPQAYISGLDGMLTSMMDGRGSALITATAVFAVLIVVLTVLKSFVFRGE